MHVLIQLQNNNWFSKSNINLNQINSWLNYNHYIQNKIKSKFYMKTIDYAYFKLEQKAT